MQWSVNESSPNLKDIEVGKSVIGITGGIGSGKSVVSRILRCNGYFVYDCDSEAKRLMNRRSGLRIALTNILGKDAFLSSGQINKSYIAEKIFNDCECRQKINAVVHSEVKKDILSHLSNNKHIFFIESAILGSSNFMTLCDCIWIIEAPLDLKLERITRRDNIEVAEIKKRIASQENELSLLSAMRTYEIKNDNIHPLLPQILNLLNINN